MARPSAETAAAGRLGDGPVGAGGGATALRLLDQVSWRGEPLPGGRVHALLAALAAARGRAVGEQALVAAIWGADDAPANPAKALQVVVSRARAQTDPAVVTRSAHGYRLSLPATDVDALVLADAVAAARSAEAAGDLTTARDRARRAVEVSVADAAVPGPLGELRDDARRTRTEADAILGRALSALGDHAEALLLLERVGAGDEASTAALLRSAAAVEGAPAALDRYERVRADLADRLGVDPGPALRAVHGELLAADHPVRSGLRYDATSLVGRDDDLRDLRAAVRESRVVSILGPGGLGKTRLAHLLGQDAEQSVVHFVELVGVVSPDDVVGEVGSALGVRDSLSGRRSLTPTQRRDVRARTAQLLEQAPALLILDNCEHVVEAVADLVAYLVATVRHLRVVTTTRAPLALAAERVFPLGQLGEDAAVELFVERARAARPGVPLDVGAEGAVRRVVRRLDGLPLALELAAAKVRAMSVEDVDRRLDDRFALLRGGDRSAPDRHQTLVAVIDWSWNLLTESQRRALRRLSVFHDGFTLDAADTVLGGPAADALDDVHALVDQSLLTVLDAAGSVRYRMLETVREFGRMQLVGAGEDDAARAAQLAWACAYADRACADLWGTEQVAAVFRVVAEEANLADCLRAAVAAPDPDAVASLVAGLGGMWTLRGENTRVISLSRAADGALAGWEPPPERIDTALQAAGILAMNTLMGEVADAASSLALLRRHGPAGSTRTRGLAAVLLAMQVSDPEASLRRLDAIATTSAAAGDRGTVGLARMWAAHHRENAGDPRGALVEVEAGRLALADHPEPWLLAMTHTLIASLHANLGDHARAAEYARLALPVLERLQAGDDVVQVRGLLVYDAISAGRLDSAAAEIAQIERLDDDRATFGGAFLITGTKAELALARGRTEEGLRLYRTARAELAALSVPELTDPDGLAPWVLFGEALAVTAHALHSEGDDGRDLYDAVCAKAPRVFDPDRPHLDYPVTGLVLHALGAWRLLRGPSEPAEDAVRCLVLADLLACPRTLPTLRTDRTDPVAEARAPGVAARLRAEYGGLRGPDLLVAARAAVAAD